MTDEQCILVGLAVITIHKVSQRDAEEIMSALKTFLGKFGADVRVVDYSWNEHGDA